MEVNYQEIGKRIRRKRKELGMTQQKLAELAGLEPSNISHIERGATKLGLPTIVSIANVLGCSVDDLLCDSLVSPQQAYEKEASDILAGCTNAQKAFLTEAMLNLKENMQRFNF